MLVPTTCFAFHTSTSLLVESIRLLGSRASVDEVPSSSVLAFACSGNQSASPAMCNSHEHSIASRVIPLFWGNRASVDEVLSPCVLTFVCSRNQSTRFHQQQHDDRGNETSVILRRSGARHEHPQAFVCSGNQSALASDGTNLGVCLISGEPRPLAWRSGSEWGLARLLAALALASLAP